MKSLSEHDLFNLLVNREDVFAQQLDNGAYNPIYRKITIDDITKHLKGECTLGLYCLDKDNMVKWSCIDIDGGSSISELRRMSIIGDVIYDLFPEFNRIKEFSGRRGYHIWILFNKKTPASFAIRLIKARLNKAGLNKYEVYPKQIKLVGKGFGNLVKIPYALHKKSNKRSFIEKMSIDLEKTNR